MRRALKLSTAAIAAVALLTFHAAPTSASTGTVNSGTLSVNLIPALNIDLAPGTGPCPGGAAPVSLDATSATISGTPNQYTITTTLTVNHLAFTYGSPPATYFLHGLSASGTGGLLTDHTPNPDPVRTGPLASSGGNLYPETSPGSCAVNTSAPICAAVGLGTSPALNLAGNFAGGATGMTPGVVGTAIVSGSGRIAAAGCGAPFAALNGRTATLTTVNVTFV